MTESQAIVIDTDMGRSITPEMYAKGLEDASAKAKLFTAIVEANGLYVQMQGRKYLTVEAWLTIAEGYGYTADIEWSRPVSGGGWEARAVVKNQLGESVAHAEAECATKGDGEWQARPSFQQRSMAQTRAISKALAAKLRWVVVLADYAPTPADEMLRDERPQAEATMGNCPDHNTPFREVPAGVARMSGKPYDAFWACPERGCRQKPTRMPPSTLAPQAATGQPAAQESDGEPDQPPFDDTWMEIRL